MLLQQSIEHLFCIVSVHVIYSRVSGQIICAHTITVLRTIPSLPFQALLNGDSGNIYNNNTTQQYWSKVSNGTYNAYSKIVLGRFV